jgi:hypothetical protein
MGLHPHVREHVREMLDQLVFFTGTAHQGGEEKTLDSLKTTPHAQRNPPYRRQSTNVTKNKTKYLAVSHASEKESRKYPWTVDRPETPRSSIWPSHQLLCKRKGDANKKAIPFQDKTCTATPYGSHVI